MLHPLAINLIFGMHHESQLQTCYTRAREIAGHRVRSRISWTSDALMMTYKFWFCPQRRRRISQYLRSHLNNIFSIDGTRRYIS